MDIIVEQDRRYTSKMPRFFVVNGANKKELIGVIDAAWMDETCEKGDRWGLGCHIEPTGRRMLTLRFDNGNTIEGYDVSNERNGEDMSKKLFWRPAKPEYKHLSQELRGAMRKLYGGLSGMSLTKDNIPILQGMAAAGIEDADCLITAIEQYNVVDLREGD